MIKIDKGNLEAEGTAAILVCELTSAFLEIYKELKSMNQFEANNFLFFIKDYLNDADEHLQKFDNRHLNLKKQKIRILL